ncbi:hypothetical protein SprV_0100230000 [Sparganum proliferum]
MQSTRSKQQNKKQKPLSSLSPRCPTSQAVRVSPLTLAAWNIRSLFDNLRSNRVERRTVLAARELERYKMDIAAPSETFFSEQGQLEKVGAGYTFLRSGRPKAERRDADVAFAVRKDMVGRMPLRGGKFATNYGLPITISDAARNDFYEELCALLATLPKENKLIVLGDFNSRGGTDHAARGGVLVHHSLDGSNENGLLFL